MKRFKAVITADIVNSSLLSKAETYALKRSVEKILHACDISYAFYRGDSFNAVCDVQLALRTVALLRTSAIQKSDEENGRFIDIRMAVGLGKIEEPFRELGTAKGEAFILSGREMDSMLKDGPRLAIRCSDPEIDKGMAAIALFVDYIIKKMTVRQAEVVYELLLGSTQVKAARKLNKSQSTINKHAHAADWKELVKVMKVYEELVCLRVESSY